MEGDAMELRVWLLWVVMVSNLLVLLHEEEHEHCVPARAREVRPKSVKQ